MSPEASRNWLMENRGCVFGTSLDGIGANDNFPKTYDFSQGFVRKYVKIFTFRQRCPKIEKLNSKASKSEPKGTKSEPKCTKSEPKGTQREPTGAETEPKESQMLDFWSQNHKNMTKTAPKINEKSRLRRGCVFGAFWCGHGMPNA